jgi:hypothetical protein
MIGMGSAKAPVTEIPYERAIWLKDQATAFDYFNSNLRTVKLKLKFQETPEGGDVFKRVQAGTIKAGVGLSSHATGVPEGLIFLGVPFGYDPARHVEWLIWGGLELQREILAAHNVMVVPIAVYPESGGYFVEAIPDNPYGEGGFSSKDWLLRWFGLGKDVLAAAFPNLSFVAEEAGSAPLAHFGSNPIDPDTGEPYLLYPGDPDKEKPADVLNGFEFSSANTDYQLLWTDKVHEARDPNEYPAEYWEVVNPVAAGGQYYYNTWHQPTQVFELWLNKDFWENELTQEERDQIKALGIETLEYAVGISQERSMRKIAREGATVGIDWPEDVLDALEIEARKIYDDHLKKSNKANKKGGRSGIVLQNMIDFGWDFYQP